MISLAQLARFEEVAGTPLPVRFPSLADAGTKLRTGELVMIAGQPGSGKSLFALDYVCHAGVPALYFSADSNGMTVMTRVYAMLTGQTIDDAQELLDVGASEIVADEMDKVSNVRFVMHPSPSLDDIDLELLAYEEAFGEPPKVVCIDNLSNLETESDAEHSELKRFMSALHTLAHTSDMCVIALHHALEGKGSPLYPSPRSDISNKINQLPELILTVAADGNEFKVATVKNRQGPADPTAKTYRVFHIDLSRVLITDNPQQIAAMKGWAQWQ